MATRPLFILTAILAAGLMEGEPPPPPVSPGAAPPLPFPGVQGNEGFRIPCKNLDSLGAQAEDLILWPGVTELRLTVSTIYGVDESSGSVVALPVPGAPTQTPAQAIASGNPASDTISPPPPPALGPGPNPPPPRPDDLPSPAAPRTNPFVTG